ncbi:MAG TPA: hypothetical protein PKH06_01460 [Candidatus Dojkabacteria bacterium]|nr:hypothetical protein [Candidatus Dojkabacteria bacterium]
MESFLKPLYTVNSKSEYCLMLKSKDQTKSINFLEPVGSSDSVGRTSFFWLTTIGKYMLIGVQAIVLCAFGFRLLRDGKNNDLADEINRQVGVLENETWKKNVVKYENLQNLLGDIKGVKDNQNINSSIISEVISGIPITINAESVSINNRRVSLSLKTADFQALKGYEDSLKNNTYYSDVKFNISLQAGEYEVGVSFSINEKTE